MIEEPRYLLLDHQFAASLITKLHKEEFILNYYHYSANQLHKQNQSVSLSSFYILALNIIKSFLKSQKTISFLLLLVLLPSDLERKKVLAIKFCDLIRRNQVVASYYNEMNL